MISGILFDKDGTLLDFNRTWLGPYIETCDYIEGCVGRAGFSQLLMREGGFIAERQVWAADSLLAAGSNEQIFSFWEELAGRSFTEHELRQIRRLFAREDHEYVPAVEGMTGFLQQLRDAGIYLGLATMDDAANAARMIHGLGLEGLFDFVCGADSGFGVKPEPGMVQAFAAHCGISCNDVCMVGDSPRDLNMGRNAGVGISVGVLTGAHGREELERHGDLVLENILGLSRLVNSAVQGQS